MKKVFSYVCIMALALVAFSCTSMLPVRFEKFVDRVESKYSSFNDEDWQKASSQFEKLMEEYENSYDKFSPEERERIDKAIGRYHAIVVKSGINSVIQSFDELVSGVTSKIKGLLDGVGSFLDELGLGNVE